MKIATPHAITALLLFVGALLGAPQADAAGSITLTAALQSGVGSPAVLLQWEAKPSGGQYEVLRDGHLLAGTGGAARYTDAKIAAGQTHTYTVLGWGKPLSSFVYSNAVSVQVTAPRPPVPAPPPAPTGLAATGVWNPAAPGAEIDLAWQPVAGATAYNVYRDGAPLQSGLTPAQAQDLSVTAGQAYSYTVSAVGPGGEGARSAAAAVTAPNPPPPAAPQSLTATPLWVTSCPKCGGMAMAHIVLAWQPVAGATAYNVYRDGAPLHSGLSDAADTDMAVTGGQSYSYTVSAVGPGGEGVQSAPATAVAPSPPATGGGLPPPSNLAVQGFWQTAGSDTLSWDPVAGAAAYNVYQYDVLIAHGVTGTRYTVPVGVFLGGVTYTVTAVDGMGMESIPSSVATASGACDPSNIPSWVSAYWSPVMPDTLVATPEWNNGAPRVALTWHHSGDYFNVYRDGQLIAGGLWGLAYYDSHVTAGSSHTYSVAGFNNLLPDSETPHSAPVTVTALTAAPAALADKVQVTDVIPNDDSVQVFFKAVPGAVDYRVYDVLKPGTVKYAGRNEPTRSADMIKNGFAPLPAATTLSIEMNGLDPVNGADLVVEAVDKLGPFQKMDGMAGPGAMTMGGMSSAINGQGDPSDAPNLIATSGPFHVACRTRALTGDQAFFDNFRGSAPFTPVAALDPAIAPLSNPYFEINEVENPNWRIRTYGADTDMTKPFVMGSHFMDTLYDGPTARTMPFSHNNNASLVMIPKATADISGGKVLHVTFEVDAHFDSRRWCDVFVGEAGDPLTHAAPQKLDGALPTVKGNLFAWEIQQGTSAIELIQPQSPGSSRNQITDLVQAADWTDQMSLARDIYSQVFGVTKSYANGSALDLDKRSRFDLYLSQNHYRTVETQPDGVTRIVRDHDFPAGAALPFSSVQVYFTHELYHTSNDRPELVGGSPEESYWYNYRPWGDERHWDNMGFEVLSAFPN